MQFPLRPLYKAPLPKIDAFCVSVWPFPLLSATGGSDHLSEFGENEEVTVELSLFLGVRPLVCESRHRRAFFQPSRPTLL